MNISKLLTTLILLAILQLVSGCMVESPLSAPNNKSGIKDNQDNSTKDIALSLNPRASFISNSTTRTNKDTVEVSVKFDQEMIAITSGLFQTKNASILNFKRLNSTNYSFLLRANEEGEFSIYLKKDSVYSLKGMSLSQDIKFERFYDKSGPLLMGYHIVSSNPSTNSIIVELNFNENISRSDLNKVSVSNGSVLSAEISKGNSFLLTLIANSQQALLLSVLNGAVFDNAGNPNISARPLSIPNPVSSNTSLSVSLSANSNLYVNNAFTVRATFSEDINEALSANMIEVSANARVSNLREVVSKKVYDFDIIASSNGQVYTQIQANVLENNLGIGNSASNRIQKIWDTKAPSVTMTSSVGGMTDQGDFQVNILIDEPILGGLNENNILVTGATKGTLMMLSPQQYTLTINSPLVAGPIFISMLANSIHDLAGNGNANTAPLTVNYTPSSQLRPTLFLQGNSNKINSATRIHARFSKDITNFGLGHLNISNGTVASDLRQVTANREWSFLVTPTRQGSFNIAIPANMVSGNLASNTLIVDYNSSPYTASINTSANSSFSTSNFSLTVEYPRALGNNETIDVSELQLTKASLSSVNHLPGNRSIILNFTVDLPNSNGAVVVNINEGAVKDEYGNRSSANNLTLNYATQGVSAILSTSVTWSQSAFPFQIQFSQAVEGLTNNDFIVTGGSIQNLTTNNNISYTGQITPTLGGSQLNLKLPANRVNAIGAPSVGNTDSNELIVDTAAPVLVQLVSPINQTSAAFDFTTTFAEAVEGLTLSDFQINNGTLSDLRTVNNSVYMIKVTPAAAGGNITISLDANKVNVQGPSTRPNGISNILTIAIQNSAYSCNGSECFTNAKAVLTQHCIGCHNAGNPSRRNLDLATEQDYLNQNLVVAANPAGSLIIDWIRDGGGSNASMPISPVGWTQLEVQKLRVWVAQIQSGGSNSGGGFPGYSANQSIRVSGRYAASVLKNVFGPQMDGTIRSKFVTVSNFAANYDMVEDYGNACNYMNDHCKYEMMDRPVSDEPTATQFADMINICEEMGANSNARSFALNKIYSGAPIATPNATSIQQAYELFFPEQTIDPGLRVKLLDLNSSFNGANNQWRGVLVNLCLLPGWQIP